MNKEALLERPKATLYPNPERGVVLDRYVPCAKSTFEDICETHGLSIVPGAQVKIPVIKYIEVDDGVVVDGVPISFQNESGRNFGGNVFNVFSSRVAANHHSNGYEYADGHITLPESLRTSPQMQLALEKSYPITFIPDQPLRTSVIVTNPDGGRAILSYTPPSMMVEKDYSHLTGGQSIYPGSLDPALLDKLLSYEGQIILSLTSADFRSLREGNLNLDSMRQLLTNPHLLLGLNYGEAKLLTQLLQPDCNGCPPQETLYTLGVPSAIITHDEQPAYYWERDSSIQSINPITDPAMHTQIAYMMGLETSANNPTGCGDTLLALVTAGLSFGMSMEEAMRMGMRGAATIYTRNESNLLFVPDDVLSGFVFN